MIFLLLLIHGSTAGFECVGELDHFSARCKGLDQAACESEGVTIFSDGVCDWVETAGADEMKMETYSPTYRPTMEPTEMKMESMSPTFPPTREPTATPYYGSNSPTWSPTGEPTVAPEDPTRLPTPTPTTPQPTTMMILSDPPSLSPTQTPEMMMDTMAPTEMPVMDIGSTPPSLSPTQTPEMMVDTMLPTPTPTTPQPTPMMILSDPPSLSPTQTPEMMMDTMAPTEMPVMEPILSDPPSLSPTQTPEMMMDTPSPTTPRPTPMMILSDPPSLSPTQTPEMMVDTPMPTEMPVMEPILSDPPSLSPTQTPEMMMDTMMPTESPVFTTPSPTTYPTTPQPTQIMEPPSVSPSLSPTQTPDYPETLEPTFYPTPEAMDSCPCVDFQGDLPGFNGTYSRVSPFMDYAMAKEGFGFVGGKPMDMPMITYSEADGNVFAPATWMAVMPGSKDDMPFIYVQVAEKGSREKGPSDTAPWSLIFENGGIMINEEAVGVTSTCLKECPKKPEPKPCIPFKEYRNKEGKCMPVSNCKGLGRLEYEVKAPTNTTDRICAKITDCSKEYWDFFWITPPRWTKVKATKTSDAVCAYYTKCKKNQVEVLAPGPFNDRKCATRVTFPRCGDMERYTNTTSCIRENNPKRCNNAFEVKELAGEKFNVPCVFSWDSWSCLPDLSCSDIGGPETEEPTPAPTRPPSRSPTSAPSRSPTMPPTNFPTRAPTPAPTKRRNCEKYYKNLKEEDKRICIKDPQCEWKVGASGKARCRSLKEQQFCSDYKVKRDCNLSHSPRVTLVEAPALDARCPEGGYDCEKPKCRYAAKAKMCVPYQELKCTKLDIKDKKDNLANYGCKGCRRIQGKYSCRGIRTIFE